MRLLLLKAYQQQVIDRCHTKVAHASTAKTLARIQENYVWLMMQENMREYMQDNYTARSCSTQGKDTNTTSTLPHLGHRPYQTFLLG